MKRKQLVALITPILIYALMPLGAIAAPDLFFTHSRDLSTGPNASFGFVVLARDGSTRLSGESVTFTISPDNETAILDADTRTTDSNGQANNRVTFKDASGSYTIQACISVTSACAVTTVTIGSPPTDTPPSTGVDNSPPSEPRPDPSKLIKISDDNQIIAPGGTVTLIVELQDLDGNTISGVDLNFVFFADDATTGSLSPETAPTDRDGRAQTTLTLSTDADGEYIVEPYRSDDFGVYVDFTVTAGTPPPTVGPSRPTPIPLTPISLIPSRLEKISGDNRAELTGETLTDPFVVEALNQDGDPVEGFTVTFTVLEGGGSLNTTTGTTDTNGQATSTLTLGTDPGTNTIEVEVEGGTETVTFTAIAFSHEFMLALPTGFNLIHVPLKVSAVDGMVGSIESVADLYDALGGAETLNWLITHDPVTQAWLTYFGDENRGASVDRGLTDQTGILADIKTPTSVRLGGEPLGENGTATITSQPRLNLVGLPLRDPRITRVSDLLGLEGSAGNVHAIVVTHNGTFKLVARAGDPGDLPITGGGGCLLFVRDAGTIPIIGDGWDNTDDVEAIAAPPVVTAGGQTVGVSPVLAMTGSVVDEGGRIDGARVTVTNLSTGYASSTVIGETRSTPAGWGYQLAVVDIAGGRAAAIGDVLEISLKSSDADIAAQPVRYTVTDEDVRQHRIQLPALALQKLPSETALLRNYPNPFNPETWIPYRLAQDAFVTVNIYDLSGHAVRTLDVGHRSAGDYERPSEAIYWDGRNSFGETVASGVYFYTLNADNFSATRKMLILK